MTLEIVGGLMSGSLALLSDAGHMLGDFGAISAAIIIAYLAFKNQKLDHKARRAGAYIHGLLLLLSAAWVLIESIHRVNHPLEINIGPMIAFAAIGGLGNYCQHRILCASEKNITRTGMHWHIQTDLWQSVAIIAASLLIAITGKTNIDLIVSVAIALVMAFGGLVMLVLGIQGQHQHKH